MEELWTINEIALKIGIPETTARRYASLFNAYLKERTFGRVKKYNTESLEIISEISNLYQAGKSTEEIHEILSAKFNQIVDLENPKSDLLIPNKGIDDVINLISSAVQENLKEELSLFQEDQHKILQKNFEALKEAFALAVSTSIDEKLKISMSTITQQVEDIKENSRLQLEELKRQNEDLQRKLQESQETHFNMIDDKLNKWREESQQKKSFLQWILGKKG